MLSYQHIYHAGNLADVHKHGLLAWTLEYLTHKAKPLCYLETHAGRALYDLSHEASIKTKEAAGGISIAQDWFDTQHPYRRVIDQTRLDNGPTTYPGSPLVAAHLLRPIDNIHLAELHPAEFAALDLAMSPFNVKCHHRDGFEMAHALTPPEPRRGIMVIDPSYEVKSDYQDIPRHIAKITRAWNVGIIFLWYPILKNGGQRNMVQTLRQSHPKALSHEVHFPPARPGHGMVGSGLFVVNPPYGLEAEAKRLGTRFAAMN